MVHRKWKVKQKFQIGVTSMSLDSDVTDESCCRRLCTHTGLKLDSRHYLKVVSKGRHTNIQSFSNNTEIVVFYGQLCIVDHLVVFPSIDPKSHSNYDKSSIFVANYFVHLYSSQTNNIWNDQSTKSLKCSSPSSCDKLDPYIWVKT